MNGSSLVQSELLANFSLVPGGPTDAGGFSLGAVLGMNNGTEVTIYLNGSYSGSYVTEVRSSPTLRCLTLHCGNSTLRQNCYSINAVDEVDSPLLAVIFSTSVSSGKTWGG